MASSVWYIAFALLISTISAKRLNGVRQSDADNTFGIVEPYPQNIYPIEFTSAQVTCVAFDSSGVKTPEKIQFMRKDQFARYTKITANDNIYLTSRTEEIDQDERKLKKLFATLHIRNVTLNDDSQYGALGRYECHAFAVGDPKERTHSFSVNVIERSEIPLVTVSKSRVLQLGDNITIFCNVTGASWITRMKKISWYKDGVLKQRVRNPNPKNSRYTLRPLVITAGAKDGGVYTCRLKMMLRYGIEHNVSDSTTIKITTSCKVDLGLVIDLTRSIKAANLDKVRTSSKHFVKKFTIGPDDTHVSLVGFREYSELHNKFNDPAYHSKQPILDLIDAKVRRLDQPTRLDRALSTVDKEMFLQEIGHRPGVRSVMVLMTDGKTNPASEDFSKAVKSLKAKGVRLLVVAVGPKSKEAKHQEVLKSIAGDEVYNASDYDNLNALFDDLEKTICPDDHDEQICAVDLALIADKTQSIGENPFKLLKGFLLEITDSMIISPFATHEAVITYAKKPKVLNKFDESKYHSSEAIHMLIENIPITLGSQTRTDKALKAAIKLFEGSRPGFPNVLVLFTDGKTHHTSEPYDQIIPLLEAKNVHIIAVGIGNNIYEEELKKIAGNNTYLVDDFDDLSNLYEILRDEICRSALDGLPAEK